MVITPPPAPGGSLLPLPHLEAHCSASRTWRLIAPPPAPGGSSELRREARDDRAERVGLLEGRLVPCVCDHLEARARDASHELLRARDRRHLIIRTGEDERRRPDATEQRTAVEVLAGEEIRPADAWIGLHLLHPRLAHELDAGRRRSEERRV